MGGSHVGNYYRFARYGRFGCDGLVRQNCCRYPNQNRSAARGGLLCRCTSGHEGISGGASTAALMRFGYRRGYNSPIARMEGEYGYPPINRVLGEAHLRRILRDYCRYYNEIRTHRSLAKDAPLGRAVQSVGTIGSHAILGGLHHHYIRI